jgi:hypothetical protein
MAKLLGDRPLTATEKQARWRAKRDAKLRRKAARRGGHTAPTPESIASMLITAQDFEEMLYKP